MFIYFRNGKSDPNPRSVNETGPRSATRNAPALSPRRRNSGAGAAPGRPNVAKISEKTRRMVTRMRGTTRRRTKRRRWRRRPSRSH